jgi:hypothetical protein
VEVALSVFTEAKNLLELVDYAFPNLQEPFRSGYAEGKGSRLDDLCKKSAMLLKDNEGRFAVATNVRFPACPWANRCTAQPLA